MTMAKKIQSNICGMLKSFCSAASAIYGCHTPKLQAHVHVWFTRLGRRAQGRLAAKNVALCSVNSPTSTAGLKQLLLTCMCGHRVIAVGSFERSYCRDPGVVVRQLASWEAAR